MTYPTLPQRVFNSPLMEYANFKDGSHVNLIKLIKPYANGLSFAVHETTTSPFCSNGLFKTYEKAKKKFDLMVSTASRVSPLIKTAKIDHSKPYINLPVNPTLLEIYIAFNENKDRSIFVKLIDNYGVIDFTEDIITDDKVSPRESNAMMGCYYLTKASNQSTR